MGDLPASIGPYRILRQLGEGGMGLVFEAMHEAIERRVAIKTLKPEYSKSREVVTRFINEARAVNRIEHPSLVQISDHGQTADGTVYLVMEFLRGETLRNRLERLHAAGARLSIDQTVLFAWQAAEALSAAHAKGIVHRDLKPDNLMLVVDPSVPGGERIKILDFGIAKLLQVSQVVTLQPRLMGTPRYMSPEQCRGSGALDGRSDVYSLGVLLFEMVVGQHLFVSESIEGLIAQHLFQEPPRLASLAPHVSLAITELVDRMIRKEPDDRPTMSGVVNALIGMQERTPALPTASALTLTNITPVIQSAQMSPLGRSRDDRRKPTRRGILYFSGLLLFITAGTASIGLLRQTSVQSNAGTIPRPPELYTRPAQTGESVTALHADEGRSVEPATLPIMNQSISQAERTTQPARPASQHRISPIPYVTPRSESAKPYNHSRPLIAKSPETMQRRSSALTAGNPQIKPTSEPSPSQVPTVPNTMPVESLQPITQPTKKPRTYVD